MSEEHSWPGEWPVGRPPGGSEPDPLEAEQGGGVGAPAEKGVIGKKASQAAGATHGLRRTREVLRTGCLCPYPPKSGWSCPQCGVIRRWYLREMTRSHDQSLHE